MPPATARRPLPVWKKLLFTLLLVGGLPLLAEGGARLVHGWNRHWLDCHRPHPQLGWCLREGWAGKWSWTGGYSRINAQGLRDDVDVGPKTPGERRILCLGDSVTFGAKVTTAEAYPQQLAARLPGIRVLNGGVSSYDPSQEAEWLELFGLPLQPDLLIVEFCPNDLYASARQGHHLAQVETAGTWLLEHSLLAFKLHRGLLQLQARQTDAARSLVHDKKGPSGWPMIETAYRRIGQACDQQHLPVLLVIFPHRDVLVGQGEDEVSPRLTALAKELGWQALELNAALAGPNPHRWYLSDDPIHPNAAGYASAAAAIADAVRERRLQPENAVCR